MSSTRNVDSVAGQGEFKPSVGRDEPLTTHGHKPGVKASPADHAPEFHAQTLPPGSAPADRTFQPNTQAEVPGQADNESVLPGNGKESTYTPATATLGGADSAQVHTGLGHPGQGQTSSELRHDGEKHRAKHTAGLQGVGASGMVSEGDRLANERTNPSQRALEKEEGGLAGQRGGPGAAPSAEERLPDSAETVASEAAKHHDHGQHRG